jgi:hypothetical protein
VFSSAYGNTKLARRLVWVAAVCNVAGLVLWCPLASKSSGALVLMLLLGLVANSAVGAFAVQQGLIFEWLLERRWKAVCKGIGFVGEGRLQFKTRLAFDPISSFQKGNWERKTIYPKLRQVYGNREGWEAMVTPFAGQTISQYNDQADAFSFAFHQPFCTFELAENGLIRLRAGKVSVPAAYDHPGALQTLQAAQNTQAVSQVVPMVPNVYADYEQGYQQQGNVWSYELGLLKGVPMARDMNGRVCRIPIESNHWFTAARTNGGKSSWIWSLVLGLEPAWRLGLVKFWGIDSKMIELAIGRGWFEHYADDDESSVALLEQCVRDMHERARQMQGIRRKFVPSVATPLNVVVIDEMGYLSAYLSDKKLQARANTAIAALLAKGRAPGYAVVGCVQDPRKEVCGFRDGFSIRIAGSLPAPMVDLVLGEGMYAAGATCDRLPITEPGVAYVISETTLKPVLVRAAWCSDSDIQGMLSGVPAQPQPLLNTGGAAAQVKDEPTGQLDWNGQPLQQFQYSVE